MSGRVTRQNGSSKWTYSQLFRYSIEGIVSFSDYPLILSSLLGFVLCLFSMLMVIVVVARKLIFGDPVAGWPSLVSIFLFISGLQFLGIGVLGCYLARVFLETKNRPMYIVSEKK